MTGKGDGQKRRAKATGNSDGQKRRANSTGNAGRQSWRATVGDNAVRQQWETTGSDNLGPFDWNAHALSRWDIALVFSYLVSRLAGTNCIFIWPEARYEGGMRGTYMPLIPRPPPRPNLGRPVWRACCPRDHLGLEGKRLQLQPRSPWGVGVACRSLQATLSLELGLFQFKPRMSPHQREGEDTWTGGLLFGHPSGLNKTW